MLGLENGRPFYQLWDRWSALSSSGKTCIKPGLLAPFPHGQTNIMENRYLIWAFWSPPLGQPSMDKTVCHMGPIMDKPVWINQQVTRLTQHSPPG